MITYEIVKECLDIIDIKYTEIPEEHGGGISVCFYDEDVFPYEVITTIHVINDELLGFVSHASGYHPSGDLYALANRHNVRYFSPRCYIDDDDDVIMHRAYILTHEVSPTYVLKDVIQSSIYLSMEGFINLELSNEEIEERNRNNR